MIIVPPTTPITVEPKVTDIVNRIKRANTQLYSIMKDQHANIFEMIWGDVKFTPKQIVDAFGTDAVILFTMSFQLQNLLKTVYPDYEVLSPEYETTLNQDGTVTVGDKKPKP